MDAPRLHDFATRYTAAWCSQNPESVAAFFSKHGSLRVNDDSPAVGRAAITEVARSFMTAFPDLHVAMDDLLLRGDEAEYRWTLTGTNTVREARATASASAGSNHGPISYPGRDTLRPSRLRRALTGLHTHRVLYRRGVPFVGVIIAPMEHGETWTGSDAACVVGKQEVIQERASRKLGRLVTISRPANTNFYACYSRRGIQLQADVIINCILKTLLAPEVSLRRLN